MRPIPTCRVEARKLEHAYPQAFEPDLTKVSVPTPSLLRLPKLF